MLRIEFLVHCSNFWFSWDQGVISCGMGGTVGSDVFLSYTDDSPLPITSLAVLATGSASFQFSTTVMSMSWIYFFVYSALKLVVTS